MNCTRCNAPLTPDATIIITGLDFCFDCGGYMRHLMNQLGATATYTVVSWRKQHRECMGERGTSMSTNPPQQASDFASISKPGDICHICSQPGVVLAYDIFAPETGMWFCAKDWESLHWPILASFLEMVEDKRPLVLFFQAVANMAAMKLVEDIFHYEDAYDEGDNDEEIERLEDFLSEETPYSYIGINNIIYLYKGDDVIADLDTDDYSWKRADAGVDPIATANALIDAIANALKERD